MVYRNTGKPVEIAIGLTLVVSAALGIEFGEAR
jgi:hypothetical protein